MGVPGDGGGQAVLREHCLHDRQPNLLCTTSTSRDSNFDVDAGAAPLPLRWRRWCRAAKTAGSATLPGPLLPRPSAVRCRFPSARHHLPPNRWIFLLDGGTSMVATQQRRGSSPGGSDPLARYGSMVAPSLWWWISHGGAPAASHRDSRNHADGVLTAAVQCIPSHANATHGGDDARAVRAPQATAMPIFTRRSAARSSTISATGTPPVLPESVACSSKESVAATAASTERSYSHLNTHCVFPTTKYQLANNS